MSNFDLSALALAGVCPGNELLYDDTWMPSVMVKIPKLTYAQLGMGESTAVHPAFIVNGQEVDAIWISKYQNIIQNGRAYSLPAQDPKVSIAFDTARAACEAKGPGWHIMTRMEWGLLVRWCENNGFIPLGNNYYGKHSTEKSYKGIPTLYGNDGRPNRLATGTGPLTWYHDNSPAGIADLCGNVWEWMGGIRTVYGEVQILANNNGADSDNSQAVGSAEWKAIKADTGELVTPDGSGTTAGTVKMDWIGSKLTYTTTVTDDSDTYHSTTLGAVVAGDGIGEAAKLLLQSLGMFPYTEDDLCKSHYVSFDPNQAERFFYSGGGWVNSSYGLASFSGIYPRSLSNTFIGFRAAFVDLPSA